MDRAITLGRTFAILRDTKTNTASLFIIPQWVEGYYYHLDGIRYDVPCLPKGRKRPNPKKVVCLDTLPEAQGENTIYLEKPEVLRLNYHLGPKSSKG